MTRLLGLDVGDRRVGVAVSDEAGITARPLATFSRGTVDDDVLVVARLAGEQHAGGLVVGLPLMPDGSEGEQAHRTRAWTDAIARATRLPVFWQDERLTSARAEAAERRLRRDRATGLPTRAAIRARRSRVDRGAAMRILQASLDAHAAGTEGDG